MAFVRRRSSSQESFCKQDLAQGRCSSEKSWVWEEVAQWTKTAKKKKKKKKKWHREDGAHSWVISYSSCNLSGGISAIHSFNLIQSVRRSVSQSIKHSFHSGTLRIGLSFTVAINFVKLSAPPGTMTQVWQLLHDSLLAVAQGPSRSAEAVEAPHQYSLK